MEEQKKEESIIAPAKNNQPTEPIVSSVEEKKESSVPKKVSLHPKHAWTIFGFSLGAIIIFLVGVMLFLPQVYVSFAKNRTLPEKFSTDTVVMVERSVDVAETDSAAAESFTDSISLKTVTDHIAPRTWRYTTVVTDADGTTEEGIEVLVFDTEAYQRQANSNDEFVMYPLEDADYTTTEEAISASSLFIPELVEYAGAERFVWNTDEQPWWYLHYRMPIDVARIEADAPEWYDPQLYPFAYEEGLGDQQVDFMLDVWINPFTGRIMHEVWSIKKQSVGDETLNVLLDIVLVRDYDASGNFTIDKP